MPGLASSTVPSYGGSVTATPADPPDKKQHFPIAAIAIAAGVCLVAVILLGILYLRPRCLSRLRRNTRVNLSRDESFCSKPPPPTPAPELSQYDGRHYSEGEVESKGPRLSSASSDDIIECYMSDDERHDKHQYVLDTFQSSRHSLVSIPYVPKMNYSRPSSLLALSSSETLHNHLPSASADTDGFTDRTITPPSPRSNFSRVYQLHDPGFRQSLRAGGADIQRSRVAPDEKTDISTPIME